MLCGKCAPQRCRRLRCHQTTCSSACWTWPPRPQGPLRLWAASTRPRCAAGLHVHS